MLPSQAKDVASVPMPQYSYRDQPKLCNSVLLCEIMPNNAITLHLLFCVEGIGPTTNS